MLSLTKVFGFASLIALAQAIQITSPTNDSTWDVSKSFQITWTSVSTDPSTVDIFLVHMASNPPLQDLLVSGISVSSDSFTVSNIQFPTGSDYQINFVAVDTTNQILAQSNQFSITGTAPSASSTLAGYTGAASTPTSSFLSTALSASSAPNSTLTVSASSATGSAASVASTASSLTTNNSTVTTSTVTSASLTGTATGSSTNSAKSSAASANASGTPNSGTLATVPIAGLLFGAVAALL